MKTNLIVLIVSLFVILSFSSCDVYTYATTQDDIYVDTYNDIVRSDVDFNIVITYGVPYYYNGTILYYLYNGLYYYPYYYNNYWYVRTYSRPFDYLTYRPYFRPNRYDYRFRPGDYRGYDHHGRPPKKPNDHNVNPGGHPSGHPGGHPGGVNSNNPPNRGNTTFGNGSKPNGGNRPGGTFNGGSKPNGGNRPGGTFNGGSKPNGGNNRGNFGGRR